MLLRMQVHGLLWEGRIAVFDTNARGNVQLLDRFQKLLDRLEFPGQNRLRFITALLASISTLAIWFIHLNHPLLLGKYNVDEWILSFIVAFAPPFLAFLCIGFSIFPPKKKVQDEKLPISTSIENPSVDRRRRIMLIAGVLGTANYLLMLATSHLWL
jgi:hypothetical protein